MPVAMTRLLEEAFDKVSSLPDEDQDAVASLILEEIESEQRWDELFANSQDKLAELGGEALEEHRAGKTKRLDPEDL